MKLLIVESPAKAKTISKYLDDKYTVIASVGHIRDLPKSNKKAIDIESGFVPKYEISAGKEKVVSEIKKLSLKAEEVVLATDPDREGEAIAWHISEAAHLKNPKRVVFHEITKDAVIEAIKHPREIDQNLRKAQEARRVLDRLVGYDLSGLIWKKVRYGLSAGRVQSPALRIIMEREREIRAFISTKYWVIRANLQTDKNRKFEAICSEEPTDESISKNIVEKGSKNKWKVFDIEESSMKRSPRAPFITSTLQQAASSRLGYSPSRTMSIAQRLYEAGHITYMRTDSTNLSSVALAQISKIVESKYGKENLQIRTYAKKSKNAQEAHEAIRPSNFSVMNAGINEEQKRLYSLIWQRTVSSQMTEAELLRTKIISNIVDRSIPDFHTNGSKLVKAGWYMADPDARGDDVELPDTKPEAPLDLLNIESEEKSTEPPSRYSEAGLIKELEKRGIGRPSTYASIIRTIEERGYVEKENKSLKPTDTGDVVSTFLENNFLHYINDTFTASMEDSLDDIANGQKDYVKTLKDFYIPFTKEIKVLEKEAKITNLGDAESQYKCPKCQSHMIIKLGKGGKFLSCATYPECDGALMMDGTEIKKEEPIGTDPETGMSIYLLVGKYGPYVQLGEKSKLKGKKKEKPKMASVPKGKDLSTVSVADALKYLSLPRVLGKHPETSENISANVGRFGPYIVHQKDFRSIKEKDGDEPYTISLERALQILSTPKVARRGRFAKKKQEE